MKKGEKGKKRILIVDDEPDMCKLLRFRLESADFDVITAYDGVDGVKKAKQEKPDLVLLDIMLPLIDGYEVCQLVKKERLTKNIPIIMLTAKSTVGDMEEGLHAGADDYITKPYDAKELIEKIKKLI